MTIGTEGLTLKEAAGLLHVSEMTIRRRIKAGTLQARLVDGKFGQEYRIELSPDQLPQSYTPEDTTSYMSLVNRIEQLSTELGYWRAKAEDYEKQVKLLEMPKGSEKAWWKKLFRA